MAEPAQQSFENHARVVPAYHMGALGIFLINLLWSLYRLAKYPGADTVVSLLLAVGFLLLFFYARVFALTVQDRVIRLEERMRYERLLPEDLKARIGEFTISQLVTQRLAGNKELTSRARKVLDEKIKERKAIKQMIQSWRADFRRV